MERKISPLEAVSIINEVFEAELIGDYSRAYQLLAVFWNDFRVKPDIGELPADIVAEVYLRCGSVAGYMGRSKHLTNAQEISRSLLTESKDRFTQLGAEAKIAECENHLALSFERVGDVKNARQFLESAFMRNLPINHPSRLHSHIIDSLLKLAEKNFEEIINSSLMLEGLFQQCKNNILTGCFYNHHGLALKNTAKMEEALDKYLTARYFFFEAGHHQYCGALENNIANLYLAEKQFKEAHNFAQKAENSFKLVGDFSRQGFSLDTRANIFLAEENFGKACEFSDKAIKLLQNGESLNFLAEAYLTKTKALVRLERHDEAVELSAKAKEIVSKIDGQIEKNIVEEIDHLFLDRIRGRF
ncbi:hypothetical protein BH20ACI4_BH20ACI4_11260 [soil metagenome]